MAHHECNIPPKVMGAQFSLIEAIPRSTWAT